MSEAEHILARLKPGDDVALARAQAFNESLSRHILVLIDTLEAGSVPNTPTLIEALKRCLKTAHLAARDASK